MTTLRAYQADITQKVKCSPGRPLVQLDTGAGKTPIIAELCAHYSHNIVLTHRNELAVQASEKLAALGLGHDTITTSATRRRAALRHVRAGHGRHIQRGHGTRFVASVQSAVAALERGDIGIDAAAPWRVWIDEAHHATPENMWGKFVAALPNAVIGGFTGTPAMLDGRPLHTSRGGLFTELIQADELRGDSTRTLIRSGYLSDYVAYAPGSAEQLHNSRIHAELAGRTVDCYRRFAPGTRCIVICTSIDHAKNLAREFSAAKIPAWHISSDQPASTISRKLDDFSLGHVPVLCAVDMVSEGFDCPEAETIIVTAHTRSFVRWRQLVGRVFRPVPGKIARIIDQAGNILTHGMPDDPVLWDILNPPARAQRLQHVPCPSCSRMYSITATACPGCGEPNELVSPRGISRLPRVVIERLDMAVVEQARMQIARAALAERMSTEIVMPFFSDAGAVGKALAAVRQWYCNALVKQGIPVVEINQFFHSPVAREPRWWMQRFTAADAASNNYDKAAKEHKKWLKSR